MVYRFQTTAYDTVRLLPEVEAVLAKRIEAEGRKRLPGLWNVIDRIAGGKLAETANEMTRGRRIYRRVVGTLLLLVGLFLVIPGFVAPDELFGPLLVGLFAIGTAVYYLGSTRKNRVSAQRKQAQRLLENIAKAPSQPVSFTDSGMRLQGQAPVPYVQINFFTETPSGFFLNWADQATFLQKKDLVEGEQDTFSTFLEEKRKNR